MAVYDKEGKRINAVYDKNGVELSKAYDVNGNLIYSEYEPQKNYDKYIIRNLFVYDADKTQGVAVYGEKIAQVREDNPLTIINLQTGLLVKEVTMDYGHGNSCQFSDEFYADGDEFPLFYVRNSGVWVFRITDTTSTLIKKYSFPTANVGTYVAGFGVDSKHKRIYTVSYTTGDYTSKTGKVRICSWDTENVTDNGNNVYTPTFLDSNDFDWWDDFDALQGCCYHNGFLFVANGYANADQKIALIDIQTMEIAHTINVTGSEIEGCGWNGNETMIIMQRPNATYSEVKFAACE